MPLIGRTPARDGATAEASQGAVDDARMLAARMDRLPATVSIWKLVALLSPGDLFEFYELKFGYGAGCESDGRAPRSTILELI